MVRDILYEVVEPIEKKAATKTLVFIHGWPDTHEVWNEQVEGLKINHRCVLIKLPMYGPLSGNFSYFGYSLSTIRDMIAKAIRSMIRHDGEKCILVVHDWGSALGQMVEDRYPELVEGIVMLDVEFSLFSREANRFVAFFVLMILGIFYQYIVIICYLLSHILPILGGYIGNFILRGFLSCFLCGNAWVTEERLAKVHSDMGYLYLSVHWSVWSRLICCRPSLLDQPIPSCRVLYLYGAKGGNKPYSSMWADAMTQREDCQMIAMPNAQHWVQIDSPGETIRLIRDFCNADKAVPLNLQGPDQVEQ